MDKLTRRQIRYVCFRYQNEATGGVSVAKVRGISLSVMKKIASHMVDQDGFDTWENFGKTWDVGEKAPLVVMTRTSSIQSEWNKSLKNESKELPIEKIEE